MKRKSLKPIKTNKGVFCPKCKGEIRIFTTNNRALCENSKDKILLDIIKTKGKCNYETTTNEVF